MRALLIIVLFVLPLSAQETLVLDRDDVVVDRDVVVRIPEGRIIEDADGDGILHVVASGVTVRFEEGSVLRGAAPGTPGDALRGIGVSVIGQKDVRLEGLRVRGFKHGLVALRAPGLHVRDGAFRDHWRQRLRSTASREDARDWLRPHDNDRGQWAERYGAAVRIVASKGVTLEDLLVRDAQNGILLERVTDSKVFDCDASFLSGWGIALWRSSDNVISRNAVDFCVRGYRHGVYNRGQDSAGLLLFEQCQRNVIADNSATHCGDGLFAFAGKEALSRPEELGINGNLIVGNDFSYAAAHGLELTFSFDNRILGNQINHNAICGLWLGYSQRTLVAGNALDGNGDAGYGLERGGVNIEHGHENEIRSNTFRGNRCGVHLWWDDDRDLLAKPWAKANAKRETNSIVTANVFVGDTVAVHLRDVKAVRLGPNTFSNVDEEILIEGATNTEPVAENGEPYEPVEFPVYGAKRPVGKRRRLAGRDEIVMTEWGPWDHRRPLLLPLATRGKVHRYATRRLRDPLRIHLDGDAVTLGRTGRNDGTEITVAATEAGVHPYRLEVRDPSGRTVSHEGVVQNLPWKVTFFPTTADPREDREAFARDARRQSAVTIDRTSLDLRFGSDGPSQLEGIPGVVTRARLPKDRFGTVAEVRVPLTAGQWQVNTVSDDGLRVLADGETLLEDWTWHGPTPHEATLTLTKPRTVAFRVEHFELDGYAILTFTLQKLH